MTTIKMDAKEREAFFESGDAVVLDHKTHPNEVVEECNRVLAEYGCEFIEVENESDSYVFFVRYDPKSSQECTDKVIASLNDAFESDPAAMRALVCNRVPCNEELADHPTIQVGQNGVDSWRVGTLGVVNGVLGALGLGLVAVMFEDEPDEDGVHKMLGFCRYEPKTQDTTE